jgi:hypothetical protein
LQHVHQPAFLCFALSQQAPSRAFRLALSCCDQTDQLLAASSVADCRQRLSDKAFQPPDMCIVASCSPILLLHLLGHYDVTGFKATTGLQWVGINIA